SSRGGGPSRRGRGSRRATARPRRRTSALRGRNRSPRGVLLGGARGCGTPQGAAPTPTDPIPYEPYFKSLSAPVGTLPSPPAFSMAWGRRLASPAMAVRFASHLGICVSDPERSLRFYRDLLGFREAGALEVGDAHSARLLGLEKVALHARFLERD